MGTPSRIILNDLGVGKHISERKRRGGEEGGERERIGEGERGGRREREGVKGREGERRAAWGPLVGWGRFGSRAAGRPW